LLRERRSAILKDVKRRAQFLAAISLLACSTALLLSRSASADELKLKDGSKINGTIVGFEENSFKVKTSYGYAVVQKDQVAAISMSDTSSKPDNEKRPEPTTEKPSAPPKPAKTETAVTSAPAAAAEPAKTTKKETASASAPPAASAPTATTPSKPATAAASTAATAAASTAATANSASAPATAAAPITPATASAASSAAKNPPPGAVAKSSVTVTPTAPAPAKPAGPPPVREEVSGNQYVNETYGFRMYKPPGWDLIAGARAIMPGALAALGTSDERTYLMIGLAPAGETLTDSIDQAEQRLREAMASFRVTDQKRLMVSGVSSIAHRFRGSVDQHEWSGIVVFVPLGAHIYTIFGMTYADSDLVQIQENVINRAITSLQFSRN
jgi:hypothetical protein